MYIASFTRAPEKIQARFVFLKQMDYTRKQEVRLLTFEKASVICQMVRVD